LCPPFTREVEDVPNSHRGDLGGFFKSGQLSPVVRFDLGPQLIDFFLDDGVTLVR
jgi:hypothetical protein